MPRSPQVHYRLKESPDGSHLIYLQFLFNGQRLFYSFGEKINKSDWNEKKERCKNKSAVSSVTDSRLNDLLDILQKETEYAYKNLIPGNIPTPDQIKGHLKKFTSKGNIIGNKQNTFFDLAEKFTTTEIKHRGKNKSYHTIKGFKTLINHLKEYQEITKEVITFESIDVTFYRKFIDFLGNRSKYAERILPLYKDRSKIQSIQNLEINSIGRDIKNLKVICNEALELGLTKNQIFKSKKFVVPKVDTEAVYLTRTEIEALNNLDLSNNRRYEKVRDLFVLNCLTGLRHSDAIKINKSNIKEIDGEYYLSITTQKTGDQVIIPCSPLIIKLMDKFETTGETFKKHPSNQEFNRVIKEVAKLAGLNSTGRLINKPEVPLYQTIGSHTARRSFATLLYLEGVPAIDVMKLTGHRSESAFLRYIKISKIDVAKRLSKHLKSRDFSETKLKIA